MLFEDRPTDWPHAATSRMLTRKPHRWHVQEMGAGPLILLIHGAGGASQSWRHLMPLLAKHARVVAVDLPGQGFTRAGAQQRCGLPEMAADLHALCVAEGWTPAALIGHSAGGAIALELSRNLRPAPPVVGINAALGPFEGLAGVLFPLMAKGLAMLPGVARLFTASTARQGSVERLIAGTGSVLPEEDLRWYRALVSDPDHVRGTLSMMAQWSLDPLLRALPDHPGPVLLLTGARDKAVPPATSEKAAARMPDARARSLPDLGHLMHEEDAEAVLAELLAFLRETGVLS